ncbi:Protein mesh-like [Oopsacas minuta]|uniref:Protein mesh-like n=1 Tax=Oopsacas minuta TaxID=111878 RepID=A0AAV7JZ95_9METZ|nr:Protein mesh-like [Oopsacas minuta]
MISESDSIFSYQTPFDYNTYSIPSFLPSFISPDLEQVSSEVKELCGDSFSCLFDAVTTGVLSFANETLIFTNIVEEIMNNSVKTISCGFPNGTENGILNDCTFFAGSIVSITCNTGYYIAGPERLSCSEDGIWSNKFLCLKQSSSLAIISVAIIIIFFLICCLSGILLIILLKYHPKMGYKVYHGERQLKFLHKLS